MARNPHRRHAKAVQRKRALKERRKAEDAGGGGELVRSVRRATLAPVHACYVQDSVFDTGLGMVHLIRKTGAGYVVGGFLVDAYCLGIKDVLLEDLDSDEFEDMLAGANATGRLEAVDPAYARKLLRDAAAWAQGLGLPPHPDYAVVEKLFGAADPDACDVQFSFGFEGRPRYVPGLTDTPTQIRRRLDILRRKLGPDGFDFDDALDIEAVDLDGLDDAFEALDEDVEAEGGYDPHIPPDPAEWLALDELERLDRVSDYHRRDAVPLENEQFHATLHLIVENQAALGDETPVRRAIERLMAEGLDRHEAVHAVAGVLAEYVWDLTHAAPASAPPHAAYNAAVEKLTAEDWRRRGEDQENEG